MLIAQPLFALAACILPLPLASELRDYRADVLATLRNPNQCMPSGTKNLPQLEPALFRFTETLLADLCVDSSNLPLAVVASRDIESCPPQSLINLGVDALVNPTQPVRSYKWGTCYPLNREHSDLILIKRLLLGDGNESLYTMLDDAYTR